MDRMQKGCLIVANLVVSWVVSYALIAIATSSHGGKEAILTAMSITLFVYGIIPVVLHAFLLVGIVFKNKAGDFL